MTLWQVANCAGSKPNPAATASLVCAWRAFHTRPTTTIIPRPEEPALAVAKGGVSKEEGGAMPHSSRRATGVALPRMRLREAEEDDPMDARSESPYPQVYAHWQRDPDGFWAQATREIDWYEPPKKVFDKDAGLYGRWVARGVCNPAYNCLDRHVANGRNDQVALIYDSPVTNSVKTFTYGRMLSEVQLLGAMLRDFGVQKGDRVIIYMPMVPEAVFAMLACARIGGVHSVVFGGFAPKELAARINDAAPKLILTASCGIEPKRIVPYKPLVDEAINLAESKPQATLLFQRAQAPAVLHENDHDWAELVAAAKKRGRQAPCVELAATDPLYILYTSGTTGK